MSSSLLASLPPEGRSAFVDALSAEDRAFLAYAWRAWARPEQLEPPGFWRVWLNLAGRGNGKTRSGSEWIRRRVERHGCRRLAVIGPTAADVRDVMIEGESGILSVCPPWYRPEYEPSKRRLTWPDGQIATAYSADEPERLRGPQHDGAWADEIGSWRYPETWDQMLFGLRLGTDPRAVATTTPRTTKLILGLLSDSTCVVTRGSTYDNRANLAPAFFDAIIRRYEGTRLGRQELNGEVLEDVPGALWTREAIDRNRVVTAPDLVRVVVSIDPSATSSEDADETGIIGGGKGVDGHLYTLADRSCRLPPEGWARRAVALYHELKADRIVAESNNGGEMVEHVIRTVDPRVPVTLIHASRGKAVRAEPISALSEQNRLHHVGAFPELEDELCTWTPEGGWSPGRLDAMVWAMTELEFGAAQVFIGAV